MEMSKLVANLKANGLEKDRCDLGKVFDEFKEILKGLTAKDKATFSLNVLCILCRNLDKVPSWRERIDNKELLTLSIECVSYTKDLEKPEQVKTLACIFHIHRHIVTQNTLTPPKLVLKLSSLLFEYEDDFLLSEYCKTYGHIIIDRMAYIQKMKSTGLPVIDLLPKLAEDVIKVTKMYDTVQFCSNMLTVLVKKLSYIYNDTPKLNESLVHVFRCVAKKDLKKLKNLSERESLDMYVKLNECFYTIMENSFKFKFQNFILDPLTRYSICLLGHRPDIFHCFQTLHLNYVCSMFGNNAENVLIEAAFNCILQTCEMTEKLGYQTAIYATYPFISQYVRLYIEHCANERIFDLCNETIQEKCLDFVLFLFSKLRRTNQLTKCENCNVKSGLHDALRLSFSVKHFITAAMNNKTDLTCVLTKYYAIVEQQYAILDELQMLYCPNQERCFRKLQTDIHNIAVLLNKHKHYDFSIKLFEIYLKYELKNIKCDNDMKNISRALYNKSICELDFKMYEKSLQNAFLSLVFSLPQGLSTDKYMSLVIDIKSKVLKSAVSDGNKNLQSMSILQACNVLYNDETYGNLKIYLKNLKFSMLLKHEFSLYIKLWPSIVPIAGVWTSLYDLATGKNSLFKAEDQEAVLLSLYSVVLETPTAVRTVHDERYKAIVQQLVERSENLPPISVRDKVLYAAVLLLKSEYDIAEASQKYGWKVTEHTTDPNQDDTFKTMEQEYGAMGSAVKAVEVLTDAMTGFESDALRNVNLWHVTQLVCLSVQQLLLHDLTAHGLQLAYLGCCVADVAGDKESYLRNASALIHFGGKHKKLEGTLTKSVKYAAELLKDPKTVDAALCLMCDLAIYYIKNERPSVAGKLIQMVQGTLLPAFYKEPDANLELSFGRLCEAQAMLCPGSGLSALSEVNGLHRHYLAVRNRATCWTHRRYTALYVKRCMAESGARSVRVARHLLLWRRASSAASTALPPSGAALSARVYRDVTNAHSTDDARVKIDNRMKFILGLIPSVDSHHNQPKIPKQDQFTQQQNTVETMLDCNIKRNQLSPSISHMSVPSFQTPEFLTHAETCTCYACSSPACTIIACQISHLESSMHYRAKDYNIAQNYFYGAENCFRIAEAKLKGIIQKIGRNFNDLPVSVCDELIQNEFRTVKIEFLIELAYFELSMDEYEKSDDHIVTIMEMLSEIKNFDPYIRNEISNLMVASAHLKKKRTEARSAKETGLEFDMEELKLSPNTIQKTPECNKFVPKTNTVKIVKAEELPKKIKVLKLNLDQANTEDEFKEDVKGTDLGSKFKVPIPMNTRPVLENVTPRPSRSKPSILVTQATLDKTDIEVNTPKSGHKPQFFTPHQSTPGEQFFTPMTSLKTYSKRNAAKKLDNEFSTPKDKDDANKEMGTRTRSRAVAGNTKASKDKGALKRATSPGKLVDEKPVSRTRKVRQPALFTNDK